MIDFNVNLDTLSQSSISTYKSQSISKNDMDFGKCFDNVSKNVQSSNKVENKSIEQDKVSDKSLNESDYSVDNYEDDAKDVKTKEEFVDDDVSYSKEAEDNAGLDTKVEEAVSKEVSDILVQLMTQIQEILGISEDELLSGMEKANITFFDLLDTKNMSQLILAITGTDSNMDLITNEEMYVNFQSLIQAVEENADALMDNMGIAEEELEALLQKISAMQNPEEIVTQKNDIIQESAVVNRLDNVVETDMESTELSTKEVLAEVSDDNLQNITDMNSSDKDTQEEGKQFGEQQNGFINEFKINNSSMNVSDVIVENDVTKYTSENTNNIIRQIVDSIKLSKAEQLTEMELQLHPASLGNVKVSLTTKGGVVTAEFITQNENVKNAIEAQAVQLRANLEEQGVKIEAIEVSVASHQMERNLDQNNQNNASAEREQENNKVKGVRKNSINLNSFEDEGELLDEMQNADDATRIAMEMMAMNGNSMDLMA